MAIDEAKVKESVAQVRHPEINNTLMELGMIDDLKVVDNEVHFTLLVPSIGVPIRDMLINMVAQAIADVAPDAEIKVQVSEMDDAAKAKFFELARKNWAL